LARNKLGTKDQERENVQSIDRNLCRALAGGGRIGGEKDKFPDGIVLGMGQVEESIESYANVEVHVLSSMSNYRTSVAIINWRHRLCKP
jgi:hypothetical protein